VKAGLPGRGRARFRQLGPGRHKLSPPKPPASQSRSGSYLIWGADPGCQAWSTPELADEAASLSG